eukprot:TRINITY_DN3743_c0_g1_i9.p1 TRINITY_DN3743_c0_g1~~TRINITY_DN3743_c0_g1_i9.p1  ORF type:complete len:296 (-),score=91.47 TRINITY_DN3743_c0_g1_i9:498-1385(-)
MFFFFFFQAEDGIRDAQESRGLGDVYKRQVSTQSTGEVKVGMKAAVKLRRSSLQQVFRSMDEYDVGIIQLDALQHLGRERREVERRGVWTIEQNNTLIEQLRQTAHDGYLTTGEFVRAFDSALPKGKLEFETIMKQFETQLAEAKAEAERARRRGQRAGVDIEHDCWALEDWTPSPYFCGLLLPLFREPQEEEHEEPRSRSRSNSRSNSVTRRGARSPSPGCGGHRSRRRSLPMDASGDEGTGPKDPVEMAFDKYYTKIVQKGKASSSKAGAPPERARPRGPPAPVPRPVVSSKH